MKTLVNGIDICYDDAGPADAPAVIFIHGFPLNRSMWASQMQLLKGRCRVIAYDLRGHGESEPGDEPFSMALFVQDLLGLMDALRIEKATLCALSMGGYVALNAAENYPERFDALVLCDTKCNADTDEAKAKRLDAIKGLKRDGVDVFAEAMLGKLFAPASFETNRHAITIVREMIVTTPEISIERALIAMREREETCSKLLLITIPTLILVGEADKIAPPSSSHYLQENIVYAHLTTISDAGHLSNLENPEAFNAALQKFMLAL